MSKSLSLSFLCTCSWNVGPTDVRGKGRQKRKSLGGFDQQLSSSRKLLQVLHVGSLLSSFCAFSYGNLPSRSFPALFCLPNTHLWVPKSSHWKDWCWSWNSNTLATWCEELTHLKRPWCWARLRAGGEGDDRGWDGWMPSLTWWTSVWASSGSWW